MNNNLAPCFRELLSGIGEDTSRAGLQATPERAAQSFQFLTSGYNTDVSALIQSSLFPATSNDLVLVKDIDFFSLCEHHILPFFGTVHVAYFPGDNILGLSKIVRVVEAYSRRLQVQEQLTDEIADAISIHAAALGVGVLIEATHLCMAMRGVRQTQAVMKTASFRGVFKTDPQVRTELYSLL